MTTMSNFKIFIKYSLIILSSLSIGIIIGVIIQSNIKIEIDNKIRYSELLNWLTAIIIGCVFGYFLKNRYENSKVIKNYLLDDLKKIILDIQDIKDYCIELKSVQQYNEDQRKTINAKINEVDKNITVFLTFISNSYPTKHQSLNDKMVTAFNKFNRKITGDGFYDSPAPANYFDGITAESSSFESYLRSVIINIIREF
jgi:hypothetical protein